MTVLSLALAIVYIWFGALKPLGVSPAADLVMATTPWWPGDVVVPLLGIFEVLIGIGFLSRGTRIYSLMMVPLHMAATLVPFVLLPEVTFQSVPFVLSLEGQYIVKNLLIMAAAWVLYCDLKTKKV